jgi:hypothetical protein
MHKLPRLLLWSSLMVAMNTAIACDSTYDPATGTAAINCIEMPGDPRSFDVSLRGNGGDVYVVTGTVDYSVREPQITGLQILTSPFPVAVISGVYPDGCWSAYKKPSVQQSGATFDIRVTARALNTPGIACNAATVPFVQAIAITPAGDPRAQTYSVNGVRMNATF